jgi:DNA-binding FadR family transcriptional regulator
MHHELLAAIEQRRPEEAEKVAAALVAESRMIHHLKLKEEA